jgi:alpha-galactosidase
MIRTLRALWAASLLVAGVVFAVPTPASAVANGLARTPPMGWNDWNAFGCGVSETLVKQTADKMLAAGLAAAGYQYVNIDDSDRTPGRSPAGASTTSNTTTATTTAVPRSSSTSTATRRCAMP